MQSATWAPFSQLLCQPVEEGGFGLDLTHYTHEVGTRSDARDRGLNPSKVLERFTAVCNAFPVITLPTAAGLPPPAGLAPPSGRSPTARLVPNAGVAPTAGRVPNASLEPNAANTGLLPTAGLALTAGSSIPHRSAGGPSNPVDLTFGMQIMRYF